MARFVRGDIVIVPFPFSDLTGSKRRPAVVLASLSGDDLILCQVTSQAVRDNYAVEVKDSDFDEGTLKRPSNARPNRIFTCDRHLILYKIGHLNSAKIKEVSDKISELLGL